MAWVADAIGAPLLTTPLRPTAGYLRLRSSCKTWRPSRLCTLRFSGMTRCTYCGSAGGIHHVARSTRQQSGIGVGTPRRRREHPHATNEVRDGVEPSLDFV